MCSSWRPNAELVCYSWDIVLYDLTNETGLQVNIKQSKTDPFQKGVTLYRPEGMSTRTTISVPESETLDETSLCHGG